MSSKTSFVSKQPKLETKLISTLSKTRRLFRLFRFNIETGRFGVSKQPKQTKDKPKQQQTFYNIHLFSSLYHQFCFFRLFRYRSETSKQTKTNRNKPKKIFLVSRKSKPKNRRNRLSFGLFRFEPRKKINGFEYPQIDYVFWGIFLVCFGLFRENSVCFGFFDTGPKHRNKPKKMFFGFTKQTEKQPKKIEFRFVSVRTEKNN